MKAYFSRLFNYDRFANEILVELILKPGAPQKSMQLMAHLLAAQQVWLNRCQLLPNPVDPLWPDWQSDTFKQLIATKNNAWHTFLDGLQPDDFDQIISYQNSKGDRFEDKLSDILAHVINHGTHHRAQAGQHLKAAGMDLPPMDYIFYIRRLSGKV